MSRLTFTTIITIILTICVSCNSSKGRRGSNTTNLDESVSPPPTGAQENPITDTPSFDDVNSDVISNNPDASSPDDTSPVPQSTKLCGHLYRQKGKSFLILRQDSSNSVSITNIYRDNVQGSYLKAIFDSIDYPTDSYSACINRHVEDGKPIFSDITLDSAIVHPARDEATATPYKDYDYKRCGTFKYHKYAAYDHQTIRVKYNGSWYIINDPSNLMAFSAGKTVTGCVLSNSDAYHNPNGSGVMDEFDVEAVDLGW